MSSVSGWVDDVQRRLDLSRGNSGGKREEGYSSGHLVRTATMPQMSLPSVLYYGGRSYIKAIK